MIESYLDINFVYPKHSENIFSEVLDSIRNEVDYSKQSNQRAILNDGGGSLSIKQSHPYSCDRIIINVTRLCNNLLFYQEDDLLCSTLSFVRLLYSNLTPEYVFGMHDWRIERIGKEHSEHELPSPISDESLAADRIEHPTWLMVFPPRMVDTYGREWLLDLPAARTEEFDDGSIMIVATESFVACESDLEIAKTIDQALEPIEDAFEHRSV